MQSFSSAKTITRLLLDWRAGDHQALDQLMPLLYDELRHLAKRYMHSERPDHTLQTTALVHEAYFRLVRAEVPWQDRAHFLAVTARVMRRILVDHAKSRGRSKRGGGQNRLPLEEPLLVAADPASDLIELDLALKRLAEFDARKSQIVECHYFGGLSYEETAVVVGVSPATIDRELRVAKAWLYQQLTAETP